MSNLVDYAKDELKRIGMVDSGEDCNDWATKAILDLIELFASQGHSGFSAPYVINAFSRLAMFKPLSSLTGEDDEWMRWEIDYSRIKDILQYLKIRMVQRTILTERYLLTMGRFGIVVRTLE